MIIIYGKSSCNWCDRAQQICEQYCLPYVYKSVDDRFDGDKNLSELKERVMSENLTISTVPQIWWHSKYLGGYEQLASEIENTRNFGQDKI